VPGLTFAATQFRTLQSRMCTFASRLTVNGSSNENSTILLVAQFGRYKWVYYWPYKVCYHFSGTFSCFSFSFTSLNSFSIWVSYRSLFLSLNRSSTDRFMRLILVLLSASFWSMAGSQTATAQLRHGLQELSNACSHLDDAFDAACDAFDESNEKQMKS